MVKTLVTSHCDSHHTNPDYKTLLVLFDGSEKNVRGCMRGNWQPSDSEVLGIVELLAELSPTFAEKLVRFAVGFNQWNTRPVEKRVVTDLAELLL